MNKSVALKGVSCKGTADTTSMLKVFMQTLIGQQVCVLSGLVLVERMDMWWMTTLGWTH